MTKLKLWVMLLTPLLISMVAGIVLYNGVMSNITGGGSISVMSAQPNGLFMHRLQTLGSLAFFGLSLGLGLIACQRLVSVEKRWTARVILAAIAAISLISAFFIVRLNVRAFMDFVDASGIGATLAVENISLYPIGLFSGLSVLLYAFILWYLSKNSRAF